MESFRNSLSSAKFSPVTFTERQLEALFTICGTTLDIEELINASNVNEQLAFIKMLESKMKDTNLQEESDALLQYLIHIFLYSPLKHPLKNISSRLLTKHKNQMNDLGIQVFKELNKIISTINLNDYDNKNNVCDMTVSCVDIFPCGLNNDELFFNITSFLQLTLDSYVNKIKECVHYLSPIEKSKIYSYVHNACRLLITMLRKYKAKYSHTQVELEKVIHTCIFLLYYEDLPIDTRINSCIVLFLCLELKCGDSFLINILKFLFDIDVEIISLLDECKHKEKSYAVKSCVCITILNTIDINMLSSMKIHNKSILSFICTKLIMLSEVSSLQSAIMLGITRGMVTVSKLTYDINGDIEKDIFYTLLKFVWSHLDHYIISVRHLTLQILSNITKFATMLKSKGQSELSDKLLSDVFYTQDNQYIYYKALTVLGLEYNCCYLLTCNPKLVENMLSFISDVNDVTNISTAFEALMSKHNKEVSYNIMFSVWIEPVLQRLMIYESIKCSNSSLYLVVMKEVLYKAIKLNPNLITMMIDFIFNYNAENNSDILNDSQLKCILLCLNVVKKTGYFDEIKYPVDGKIEKWKGIISFSLLHNAIYHYDTEISLLVCNLIIDTHKTTEIFISQEFNMIENFLTYNINNKSPNVRQEILSIFKKLLVRWQKSYTKIRNQINNTKNKIDSEKLSETENIYRHFLSNIVLLCLKNIFPGASFSRRNVSLQLLVWICDICNNCDVHSMVSKSIDSYQIKLLCDIFNDSYECNKQLIVKFLSSNCGKITLSKEAKDALYIDAIKYASSIKPIDCTSSAYKLEFCLSKSDPWFSYYHLIKELLIILSREKNVAEKNILEAANSSPMYGLLYCIRHIFNKVDFKSISDSHKQDWSSLIDDIIRICFEINKIVCPIVNNSSPEGYLPMTFIENTFHSIEKGVLLSNGKLITAQMLLLCGWRSVKEVSLLLGEISNKAIIVDDKNESFENTEVKTTINNEVGMVRKECLLEIGDHFVTLLSETKHRGAFEQAYIGFSNLCMRLWKCKSDLYNLPHTWLDDLMRAIASGDAKTSKLCATRRSAGVPFIIQALVITELQANNSSQTFDRCMNTLISLARNKTESSVETRTHCLNILRALFRHTALGEYVNSYVTDGIIICIEGFEGSTWAERNSSTLLFSSLMTRIFGVQKMRDTEELSIRNKMTGRTFFSRYPKLFDYLLDYLKIVSVNTCASHIIKPSLYPVLLLLSRLYPSSLEGTDSNLQLSAFIPYITVCSGNCILKIRELAAKSIVPLVNSKQYMIHINWLLNLLNSNRNFFNMYHGILLQIIRLFKNVPQNFKMSANDAHNIVELLKEQNWIFTYLINNTKPCYIIAKAFLETIMLFMNNFYESIQTDQAYIQDLKDKLFKLKFIEGEITLGQEQFHIQKLHLEFCLMQRFPKEECTSNIIWIIMQNLYHPLYEVTSVLLNYIFYLHNDNLELYETNDSERYIVMQLSKNEIENILEQLNHSPLYRNWLLELSYKSVDYQLRDKVLDIISYTPDATKAYLHDKKSENISLYNIIENCCYVDDKEAYLYLKYINTILDHTTFDIKKITIILKQNSSHESNINNKIAVIDIFLKHWKLFEWEFIEDYDKFSAVIEQYNIIFLLLSDEDNDVSQKMCRLANLILAVKYKNNGDYTLDKFNVNVDKAREILLEIFVEWMCKNGYEQVIAMLIVLGLGNAIWSKHNEEDQVFDKENYDNTEEECLLMLYCMKNIVKMSYCLDFHYYISKIVSCTDSPNIYHQIYVLLQSNQFIMNYIQEANSCNLKSVLKLFLSKEVTETDDKVIAFKIHHTICTMTDIFDRCCNL